MFGGVQWCSLKGAPAAGVDDAHAVGPDNVEELSIPSPFEVRGEVSPRKGRSTAFTVAPRTFSCMDLRQVLLLLRQSLHGP